MTTRRDFCKNLLAVGIASASLHTFAKSYCGIDFGKRDSWAESCFLFFQGGLRKMAKTRFSPEISPVWFRELRQLRETEYAGGRASPKSLYLSPPKPCQKSKREKQKEKYRWLWFEEASEFENWQRKGDKA